jgi:hypothetical protein
VEVKSIVLLVVAILLRCLSGDDPEGVGTTKDAIRCPLVLLPERVETVEAVEEGGGIDDDVAHLVCRASNEAIDGADRVLRWACEGGQFTEKCRCKEVSVVNDDRIQDRGGGEGNEKMKAEVDRRQ